MMIVIPFDRASLQFTAQEIVLEKISDKQLFCDTLRIGAFGKFKSLMTDPFSKTTPKWRGGDIDQIAASAAFHVGLAYWGDDVDPAIVNALRVLSKIAKSDREKDEAVEDAWRAYCSYEPGSLA